MNIKYIQILVSIMLLAVSTISLSQNVENLMILTEHDVITLRDKCVESYSDSEYIDVIKYGNILLDSDISDTLRQNSNYSIREEIQFYMGQAAEKMGKYDDAIVYYENIIDKYPNSYYFTKSIEKISYLYFTELYEKNDIMSFGSYIMKYVNTLGESTRDSKLLYLEGISYFKENDYQQAITSLLIFVGVFQNDSLVPHALMVVAKSYLKLGEHENAYKIILQIIPEKEEVSNIDIVLSRIAGDYFSKKVYDRYVQISQLLIEYFPESKRTFFQIQHLIYYYFYAGEKQKASDYLTWLLDNYPLDNYPYDSTTKYVLEQYQKKLSDY